MILPPIFFFFENFLEPKKNFPDPIFFRAQNFQTQNFIGSKNIVKPKFLRTQKFFRQFFFSDKIFFFRQKFFLDKNFVSLSRLNTLDLSLVSPEIDLYHHYCASPALTCLIWCQKLITTPSSPSITVCFIIRLETVIKLLQNFLTKMSSADH